MLKRKVPVVPVMNHLAAIVKKRNVPSERGRNGTKGVRAHTKKETSRPSNDSSSSVSEEEERTSDPVLTGYRSMLPQAADTNDMMYLGITMMCLGNTLKLLVAKSREASDIGLIKLGIGYTMNMLGENLSFHKDNGVFDALCQHGTPMMKYLGLVDLN